MGRCRLLLCSIWIVLLLNIINGEQTYYELLGIEKTADSREIRKAFKKLAVLMHPDKNKDDPDAQDKFLRLKKAYEVLKDEESRKTYDLYGEKGVDDGFRGNREYNTWNFYKEQFGIYDDDPEIITLSSTDFEQNVRNSYEIWFINFYSPSCSHCHILAPNWRELGRELNAVVKIAAINCEEDWLLCRQEGISSYPSLVLYPSKEKYYGERTTEDLQNFVLHKLPVQLNEISSYKSLQNTLQNEIQRSTPWLLIFCKDTTDSNCPTWQTRTKLSTILQGLVTVALVDCSSKDISCKKLGIQSGTIYVPPGNSTLEQGLEIHSLHYLEIATRVLEQLPDAELLQDEDFEIMQTRAKEDIGTNWLLHFEDGDFNDSSFATLQYRRLPALLSNINFGQINCQQSTELCKKYYISKYPTFATYKKGGTMEVHVGGVSVSEIVSFVRASIQSPNLQTLTPSIFPNCLNDGHPWVIDFYAPWCPPCLKLVPEFRKASQMVGGIVQFGSLDCSVHRELCVKYSILAYPTIVLYNDSSSHSYVGQFAAKDITEFVEDILRPPVIHLTIETFDTLVTNRPITEAWVVDFYASWCGPCIQLAPQWRRLARMLSSLTTVHVASVDCVTQVLLCNQHGISSYPTIRFYPMSSSTHFIPYSGYQRDASSLKTWLLNLLPSSVYSLTDHTFVEIVLKGNTPWVIDFYAPWCGPCHVFGSEFELAAKILEGRAKFGKINCDVYYSTCQIAFIRAYPSVRFYPGKSSWKAHQDPAGITFTSTGMKAEDVVTWLENQLTHSSSSTSNPYRNHDEL